jgi:pimeloyl-ACP methyl ester carboxylesterase
MSMVDIGDIEIFYEVFFNGEIQKEIDNCKKILIVLHGGPGFVDHTLYIPFWSQVAEDIQIIFPDQRGNGRSGGHDNPETWNLEQCGNDIVQFCEALNIKKPIVAGISWGGYVAMSYITNHPEHPRAAIFCNTEAKVSAQDRKEMFKKLASEANGEEAGKAAGDAVWNYDNNPSDQNVHSIFMQTCLPYYARHKPYTAEEIAKCIQNLAMRKKFMEEENLSFDFREDLEKTQCPVLILAGTHDAAHPLPCAEETAKSIPESLVTFIEIEDAGAPVYNDQPELTIAAIQEFIIRQYEDALTVTQKVTL